MIFRGFFTIYFAKRLEILKQLLYYYTLYE